ncbi:MAG: hypothetical protein EOP84_36995 [Verrucomicrobiaceae bacterium]|nr:MAG: hypothetical protein EOP84_36995 [Verrucomicrobiaceae bacterium]
MALIMPVGIIGAYFDRGAKIGTNELKFVLLCLFPVSFWVYGMWMLIRLWRERVRFARAGLLLFYIIVAVFCGIGACGAWERDGEKFYLFEPPDQRMIIGLLLTPIVITLLMSPTSGMPGAHAEIQSPEQL